MSSGRQVQDESVLSAKHAALNVPFQASFSNKLTIFNNTNPHKLMAKRSYGDKSNLTINIGQSAYFAASELKRLSKQISRNANFSKAELTHYGWQWHLSEKYLGAMLSCLAPMKSLSSLKLNLFHPRNLKENTFKNLAIGLPNLLKLEISFAPNSNTHTEILTDLGRSLTYFPHLTKLSLNLSSLTLTNDEIWIVAKKIQRLKKRVTSLKLNLSRITGLSSIGVEGIAKSLMKLEKLTNLELDLSECPLIEDQDIEKLFASLKMIKTLSSVSLALRVPGKLTQKSLQVLLGHENSSRQDGIITLDIVQIGSEIKQDTFEPSSFSQLTRLHLDLTGWSKGEAGVTTDLGGSFRGFPTLSALDLSVGSNQMLDKRDLTEICISLIRLKSLSRLHLNFSSVNENLTNQAIISLGHALKTLTNLVDFKLDTSECLKINHAAWSSLFQDMGSLIELTNLSLNFSNCKGITEHEFQQLSLSLTEMKFLIFLELDFAYCHLHDATLQNLGFVLKNLRNLQVLTAVLYGNKKINSKGFLSMSSGFSEAQSLTEVNLNVDPSILPEGADKRCSLVHCLHGAKFLKSVKIESSMCSEAQLLALSSHLVELEHVPCIKLHFLGGDGISPNTKAAFTKNMRKLSGLKEFELLVDYNRLNVWFDDFYKIHWRMKDIQAGSGEEQIVRYKEAIRRERRIQRKELLITLIIMLIFFVILGLVILIPWAIGSKSYS